MRREIENKTKFVINKNSLRSNAMCYLGILSVLTIAGLIAADGLDVSIIIIDNQSFESI